MNKENYTVSQWELTSLGSALVTHPLTADSSIFHNHCNRCEAFGRSVGDKTEGHCNQCGKHYSELGYSGDVKFKCGGRGRKAFHILNLHFHSCVRAKFEIKVIFMYKLILQRESV